MRYLFFSLFAFGVLFAHSQPVRLTCEHLINPLGIDEPQPRMQWQLASTAKGAVQTAWQIWVGTDSAQVAMGNADCWATPKTGGDRQQVRYEGKSLQPFTRYYWKLSSWNENDEEASSAVSHFETGMMNEKNWTGNWISDTRDTKLRPAAMFRKAFATRKPIRSARLYIAAAGLFDLNLNGKQVSDQRLNPMYTRFDRRNLYCSFDVTGLLQEGENCIGVTLGNGWYNHQSTAVWFFDKAPWRQRPSFCLDLRVEYKDGTIQTIATDQSWKTHLSPIIFNSIYTGEHYDARLEIPHWNAAGFADTAWKQPIYCAAPSNHIVSQVLQPIRLTLKMEATSMRKINDTDYVFSFPLNISGVSDLTVSGPRGTIVRLKHGEKSYENGRVDQSNIDVHYRPVDDSDPFQTDIYTLKGEGTEHFMPRFNYKGFQYVELTCSQPLSISAKSLAAWFQHSDVPAAGGLQSSNPTIDKIWSAANQSYLSNLAGYPTDCPQREKNGWTGDAQINIETGLYNYDGITIYEKWLADHRDEQQPNGVLPSIVPTDGWGYEWGNGPDWTSTIAVIPWQVYLFYGDTTLLMACYDNIKRYVDHIDQLYPSGITSWGLGDWIPVKSKSPVPLTSTCYYYADVQILANAARLKHNSEDEKKYTALAQKIKNAFNEKYLDRSTGKYADGLQTEQSVPLFWGLAPDELKPKIAAALAARVRADSVKLDVGLLGTKAILNALSENGYGELAYQLASSQKYPSWGWWIVNGATTLYENWPINAGHDISLNHIMFGEVSAWMYKSLGGIHPDPAAPGFKHILLSPQFPPSLDSFSCYHLSPFGKIISSWKKDKKHQTVVYHAVIPSNCSATVHLTGGDKEITAGDWTFVVDNKRPKTAK